MRFMISVVSAAVLLSVFSISGHCGYVIHLKNGGCFETPRYWKDGPEILFNVPMGIVGVELQAIKRIEETTESLQGQVEAPSIEEGSASAEADEGKLDVKACRDRKNKMVIEVDSLAERMREATAGGDREAEARLRDELRRVSARIYELTDEVKEKNEGVLPDGWWERP